ncbi:MAG: hypothetical protein NTZ72_04165 [Afipia sp.]|nr:hypothetical protein [Afipia sp.]
MRKNGNAEEQASVAMRLLPARLAKLYAIVAERVRVSFDNSDTYQPEQFYMRGPGPKWREKHGLARARLSRAKPIWPTP